VTGQSIRRCAQNDGDRAAYIDSEISEAFHALDHANNSDRVRSKKRARAAVCVSESFVDQVLGRSNVVRR
jgi:hypothetical protein